MQNWFSKGYAIAFLLIGLFALGYPRQTAHACTPTSATNPSPPPIQYTIEERVTSAPIVLEGTVISTEPYGTATIQVLRYFKGNGPAIITGVRYGDGAMCQIPLFPGGPIIIFISEWQPGVYAAHYFGDSATIPATEDNIQQIITAAGQSPRVLDLTPTPLAVPEVAPLNESDQPDDVSGLLEFCLMSFLPLAMGIIVVRRRINP